MNPDLTQRCTVILLAALALGTGAGLIAWGPVVLSPQAHDFADHRMLLGMPYAVDVLTHLPVLAAGLWGWHRVRSLAAPDDMKRPWGWFFLATLAASLMGAFYHWAPSDARFVLSQLPRSASCALLLLVFMTERVDARWGSRWSVGAVLPAVALGGLWWWSTLWSQGAGDLRPLLWIGLLPLLLTLAGVWHLPGSRVSGRDWLIALITFAAAHLLQLVDHQVMAATGGVISGHTLHHLALAACIGWLAYRADVPVRSGKAWAEDPPEDVLADEPIQVSTS